VVSGTKDIGYKTKELGERAAEKTKELGYKTKELGERATEKTKELGYKTKALGERAAEKTKELGERASEKTKELGYKAKEKMYGPQYGKPRDLGRTYEQEYQPGDFEGSRQGEYYGITQRRPSLLSRLKNALPFIGHKDRDYEGYEESPERYERSSTEGPYYGSEHEEGNDYTGQNEYVVSSSRGGAYEDQFGVSNHDLLINKPVLNEYEQEEQEGIKRHLQQQQQLQQQHKKSHKRPKKRVAQVPSTDEQQLPSDKETATVITRTNVHAPTKQMAEHVAKAIQTTVDTTKIPGTVEVHSVETRVE
jgi:hypothetical protein